MSLTLLKSFTKERENRLRIDNPETMDEGKQSKSKNITKNKTKTKKKTQKKQQQRKLKKDEQNGPHQKLDVKPG